MIERTAQFNPQVSNYAAASKAPQFDGKAASVFRDALAQELDARQAASTEKVLNKPAVRPEISAYRSKPIQPAVVDRQVVMNDMAQKLQPVISEVRQIADYVGLVDVKSQDIIRAYQRGDSFLADYRV